MLQWKLAGTLMIIPTITIAIIISVFSFRDKSDEFWINMAICFWIGANSYWMLCEFTGHETMKDYAGFPFLAGMVCVAYFYIQRIRKKRSVIE